MKSEAVVSDRVKIESRQSLHRRKMSKNSPIVNGADESLSYVAIDDPLFKLNFTSFHDQIPCVKLADLLKTGGNKTTKIALPCETDHIYANSNETKNKSGSSNNVNNPKQLIKLDNTDMREMLLCHLDLIQEYESEVKDLYRQLFSQSQEIIKLRCVLDNKDTDSIPMSKTSCYKPEVNVNGTNIISQLGSALLQFKNNSKIPSSNEHSNPFSSVNLVTRYFGRRSKTIPSRALKRRYLGPPKSVPLKNFPLKSQSSAPSISSASELHEEETLSKTGISKETKLTHVKSLVEAKKVTKKRSKRQKGLIHKSDFLTTDKPYFVPETQKPQSSLPCFETIDVPSWKLKPVTSFYQMEGTENINDSVFERRHLKYEHDERRRKRWDIQRLREQKASLKLKHKYCREMGKESDSGQQKPESLYPDLRHLQYIEVTDQLPVLAFGQPIPLFQPSEFSISWNSAEKSTTENLEKVIKKNRQSATGQKVT